METVVLDAIEALLLAARPAAALTADVRDGLVQRLLDVVAAASARGDTIEGMLATRFGLAPIELGLLWLAAAPRFRPHLSDAFARASSVNDLVSPRAFLAAHVLPM